MKKSHYNNEREMKKRGEEKEEKAILELEEEEKH